MKTNKQGSIEIAVIAVICVFLLSLLFVGVPNYKVYIAGKAGEALLMKANQEKQIMIAQAQAEKDSAVLRSEAIAIIGQASKDFPEYRLQEFIGAFGEAMTNGSIEKIIYVPTEAMIPILEAK